MSDRSGPAVTPAAAELRQQLGALPGTLPGVVLRLLTRYPAQIAAITALGTLGRLLLLDRQPLWRDEAFTALAVRRSLAGMLDAVRHDSAPPLAYLIDRLVSPFSTAPAALRLMPALAGGCAIPLGAALGRRVGGDRAGRLAAAVCAASPALFLASRDARMYALATTLVMASALALWRAVEQPRLERWALYGLTVILALHTQYFAAFAVGAQLVAALLLLRPDRRTTVRALATLALSGLAMVPWMAAAAPQLSHGAAPFWVGAVGPSTLGGVVLQLLGGPPVDQGVAGRLWLQLLQAMAVGAGGMAAYALLRQRGDLVDRRRAAAYLAVSAIGALVLFLLASLWHPLVEARYASVVWGPLFPLLGAGLALVRCRPLVAVALASLAATSTALAVAIVHPDSPTVAARLHHQVGPHDLVASDPEDYLLLLYYADPLTADRLHVVSSHVSWFWGTAVYPPGAVIPRAPDDVVRHHGAIHNIRAAGGGHRPTIPPGYATAERTCSAQTCIEREVWVGPPSPPPER